MSYIKTKGLIIKEVNTGEADKIVTIFSRSRGRISALAKGARRPRSKLVAGTQFLSYCDYLLFSGREMYSINSCEVEEPFYEIRNDMIRLTYAVHFIDIINDAIQENQPSPKVLQLLLNSLHMLSKTDKEPELIARIFELRFLSVIGFAPFVKGCIICGREDLAGISFSFRKCGFICSNEACITNDAFALELSQGAVKAIQHIVHSKADELFSFTLSPPVLDEVGKVTKRYLRERLEKDYKKLDFLKEI
ncbi:MAG: DNA repair protein RecO [Ruminiclostridium sp.]|nr:DNA repair protein RecO [Ruminiclostridium sp.]